jgi:hypothetical protein
MSKISDEYVAWCAMKQRCFYKKHQYYRLYGGRGISVSPLWKKSFETFLRDVGPKPSRDHSLERRDSNGNYEPGNVYWATAAEQSRNTCRTILVSHLGQTLCLKDWAIKFSINPAAVWGRWHRGLRPPELFQRSRAKRVKREL